MNNIRIVSKYVVLLWNQSSPEKVRSRLVFYSQCLSHKEKNAKLLLKSQFYSFINLNTKQIISVNKNVFSSPSLKTPFYFSLQKQRTDPRRTQLKTKQRQFTSGFELFLLSIKSAYIIRRNIIHIVFNIYYNYIWTAYLH